MNADRIASSGAAEPGSASVRSTSSRPRCVAAATRRTSLSGAPVFDRGAQSREVLLELEGQGVVADAQRDLDELEVIEIGAPRGRVGLLGLAGGVQGDAVLDQRPRLVQLDEGLGFGDVRSTDRHRGQEADPADQREDGDGEEGSYGSGHEANLRRPSGDRQPSLC